MIYKVMYFSEWDTNPGWRTDISAVFMYGHKFLYEGLIFQEAPENWPPELSLF